VSRSQLLSAEDSPETQGVSLARLKQYKVGFLRADSGFHLKQRTCRREGRGARSNCRQDVPSAL